MNRTKILFALLAFAVAIIVVTPVIVNPFLKKKILSTLNDQYPDYEVTIDKVRWMLIPSRLTLKDIIVQSSSVAGNATYFNGRIATVRFNGIRILKALFKKEYEIDKIIISHSDMKGKLPFRSKEKIPLTSTTNILIDQILFEQINLALSDSSTAQTLMVRQGMLRITDFEVKEKDTLGIFHNFDFKAHSVVSNSQDSMYTYLAKGVVYSDSLKMLSVDSLSIDPNYKGYDFTSRFTYETDCFDVKISDLKLYQFSGDDFYNSGRLVSSCVSIGHMDLEAFRDKRKQDTKENKPEFQSYIYRYPGFLKIDSMIFNKGNITYMEHADEAVEAGRVHLNDLKVKIYNITNDTIYKTRDTSLTVTAQALLMGKSKMDVLLKAKLFDPMNTFSLRGTLAAMEVKELNPILEKNAFIYTSTARINQLKFNFVANDTKATGEMVLLYEGLNLAVKNKSKDTPGLKEQIFTLIANKSTWDSNPLPKEEVRVGIIDYERDPTKFVFNYCVKAIVSGVKSTIVKLPIKKKSFLQRIFSGSDEKQKDAVKT